MPQNVIFISYRRGLDSGVAGRLHDRLQARLKNTTLFMDVTDMPLGSHFVDHIRDQVSRCNALVAVIGPGWTADIERLSDKGDFVRLEIEAALNRGDIPVIPVFVEGTPMPDPETLPRSLRSLVYRSGITLSHENFVEIVDGRLTQVLEDVLGVDHDEFVVGGKKPVAARAWPVRKMATIGAVVLGLAGLLGGIGYLLFPEDTRSAFRAPEPDRQPRERAAETLPVPEPQPSSGTLVAQLAALGSLDDARRKWQQLSDEYPEVLSDRKFTVSLQTVDGKIYYRLRVIGFQTKTERDDLCDKMEKLNQECWRTVVD